LSQVHFRDERGHARSRDLQTLYGTVGKGPVMTTQGGKMKELRRAVMIPASHPPSSSGDAIRDKLAEFGVQGDNRFYLPRFDRMESVTLPREAYTSVIALLEREVATELARLDKLAPNSHAARRQAARKVADYLAILAPLLDAELAHLRDLTDSLLPS
jgi:hypothetical protein